ncbi:sensor histidine kinase [Cohnella sp. CFH 77786]|uniref:sensor histidine kinase n=1 Tax=Cohnella sp. CFH 77786 TaxID=2662265 RepID=UPI001C60C92F|nr:ATP-binding protein [Cohnella sp. CFH 77786]MBW5446837.1 sensor histidine kinase [Cohnella sp. CFH 77786]
MIKRTRIELTIRNAAVLSVILISLNLSVYWLMKEMLFAQVDRSMTGIQSGVMETKPAPALSDNFADAQSDSDLSRKPFVTLRLGQTERPVIQLHWTKNLKPIPMPGIESFTDEQLDRLVPTRFAETPETVNLGDAYFRVRMAPTNSLLVASVNGTTYAVAYQQILTNVTAEIGMLHRLQNILLFGGIAGLLVAVGAGFYLANRALTPIRISMERQQQFVSDASHELRTPLSVIQAHAELLLRHPDHTIEQDSKHVSTVLQEARRMSKLVGGLLTLARSDAGVMELDIKTVLMDRVIQDCVNKLQALAEMKDIILQAETDSSVPIQADEERLHQLLTIVLDNAIKYTPEGGLVRIACRKLPHSVFLEIEDTGIGIAPEHLSRVFDRFYRSDKARTRQEGGTGLGLAIAKWIVERHGGKIRVESKLSVGTQVRITLPA